MRWYVVSAAALLLVRGVFAQTPEDAYSYQSAWSVFADYSNDSSHIFLGTTQNRRIAGLGASFVYRLAAGRHVEWSYEAEVRPLYFVRDPVSYGQTITVTHMPGVDVTTVQTFDGPVQKDCASGTTQVTGSTPVMSSTTTTQTCGSRWTYAGGISPIGQRVSFARHHRLQPFFVANAGILIAPHDIPANHSSKVNFTFEGGAGLEWFPDRSHSWAFDYRVHHLSNAYTGDTNPGIDSGIFRVAYRFGR